MVNNYAQKKFMHDSLRQLTTTHNFSDVLIILITQGLRHNAFALIVTTYTSNTHNGQLNHAISFINFFIDTTIGCVTQ
jgi:hypothetical protein